MKLALHSAWADARRLRVPRVLLPTAAEAWRSTQAVLSWPSSVQSADHTVKSRPGFSSCEVLAGDDQCMTDAAAQCARARLTSYPVVVRRPIFIMRQLFNADQCRTSSGQPTGTNERKRDMQPDGTEMRDRRTEHRQQNLYTTPVSAGGPFVSRMKNCFENTPRFLRLKKNFKISKVQILGF